MAAARLDAPCTRGFEERKTDSGRIVPAELRTARRQPAALTQRAESRVYAKAPEDEQRVLGAEVAEMERDLLRKHRQWELQCGQKMEVPTPVSLSSLQRVLEPDECFMEFYVGPVAVHILLVDCGRVELLVLTVDVAELSRSIEDLVFQIDNFAQLSGAELANSEFFFTQTQRLLRRLYDGLLRPVESWIREKRLLLVLHRELQLVPFEAVIMSSGAESGEGSAIRVGVRRISTVRQLLAKRRAGTSGRARGGIALTGNVEGGPELVGREVQAIAKQLQEYSPVVLLDPTPEAVRAALRDARVAHLSTHGRFRSDSPLLSRLSFRGGALFLSDLLEESLSSDLVVLSTCESGCAYTGQGEDLVGLSYGFLSAGVDTLMASLWRVDDAATEALMLAFYAELIAQNSTQGSDGTELDPDLALARARESVRSRWPHPFYWAAFTLYGG